MGMDVAPVSAFPVGLFISSHFFSPFVKDNVLYFPLLHPFENSYASS